MYNHSSPCLILCLKLSDLLILHQLLKSNLLCTFPLVFSLNYSYVHIACYFSVFLLAHNYKHILWNYYNTKKMTKFFFTTVNNYWTYQQKYCIRQQISRPKTNILCVFLQFLLHENGKFRNSQFYFIFT